MGKVFTITIPRRKAQNPERVIIRARSTQDAFSLASLYDDLANRLAQAWVDLQAEGKTKDEKEGHEFHGNQYVDVPGSPKPTSTVAKTAKHAVHELLSSGHPFTIEELGSITGHANPKTLAAWMTMFKSPKYAGPKGVLDIKKLPDGSYQVIKPDGTPAPANPKLAEVKEANAAIKEEHGDLSEMKPPKGYVPTQVKPPPEPHPDLPDPQAAEKEALEAAIKQASPGVESVHHVKGGVITVPKEPLSLGDATDEYQDNLISAQNALSDALEMGAPTSAKAEALVLAFKQEKALFMAQWKTSATGKFHEPKKHEQVFQADKKLVDDLVSVHVNEDPDIPTTAGIMKAFADWKANTKLEKMGKFGVKAPEPVKPAKADPHTNSAPVSASSDLAPKPVTAIAYDQLVPKDHEAISPDDFEGSASKPFSYGMIAAKNKLEAQSSNAQANKKTVEVKLRARLKDAHNFSALRKVFGDHAAAAGINSLEAKLVATWAGSSGGANPLSNAMQLAVQEAFSIPEDHVTKQQLKVVKAHGNNHDAVYHAGAKHLGLSEDLAKKHLEVFKKGLHEFAHAQYHETQDLLKSQGIEHMYLARGMKIDSHTHKEIVNGPVQLKLQPASSFSVNYGTAKSFGGAGTVFLTKVPRSQILSTYLTGFGCSKEHEVVVIAHENLKSYGVAAAAADTAKSAAEIVASKIKQKAKVAA